MSHDTTCHEYISNYPIEIIEKEINNIKNIIQNNPIVIFMKGTQDFPQCGFSAMAVNIIQKFTTNITTINVLKNDLIRTAIKEFTKHYTIPQIFINKNFVGGASEVKKLFETNQLHNILKVN